MVPCERERDARRRRGGGCVGKRVVLGRGAATTGRDAARRVASRAALGGVRCVSGVSQIMTRCLQPLFDFTSFIQRKYFTLVTFTSTGLSYEYITSALFTHTVHP